VEVKGCEIIGQWDIAVRDLDNALGLDANEDGAVTWGELRAQESAVATYALARLRILAGSAPCPLKAIQLLVDQHADGVYAVLRFAGKTVRSCERLTITYRLLFDLDPLHRGLFRLRSQGRTYSAVFSPGQPSCQFDPASRGRYWEQFLQFGREGVWHIWRGFDHVLFLLALLLPAVLRPGPSGWQVVPSFGSASFSVLKIVTAFTVAHSLTLSLATLGVVRLPSRLAESVIAASVAFAAINNLFPYLKGQRWYLAFGFGLVHGFGFASVLTDLGLETGAKALSLLAFNLGVEVGQLAIVLGFLPLAFVSRHSWCYRQLTLRVGSALIACLAVAWLVERAFSFKILAL
jgi:hypothetical protein